MKLPVLVFLSIIFNNAIAQINLNSYYPVTGHNQNCGTLTLGSTSSGLQIGDDILIIQMKGATIDSSNNANFGNLISIGNAGNYEFNKIVAINGNTITLEYLLAANYTFSTGNVQIVKVFRSNNYQINNVITPTAWNPATRTGGVVVLWVDTLNFSANINANGSGFRGGVASVNGTTFFPTSLFFYPATNFRGAQKGESIYILGSDKTNGRGPNYIGGGGGNDVNSGGAGGANIGTGGRGGEIYNGNPIPTTAWGIGGRSAITVASTQSNKIISGGGGGGGQQNDAVGTNGGNAGGIVIIKSKIINGNNFSILANGNNALEAGRDGGGGGGAGGSVVIQSQSITNLNIQTRGGNGANSNSSGFPLQAHGTGGGGGGGRTLFLTASPNFPTVINNSIGGNPGLLINTTLIHNNTPYFAEPGSAGATYYTNDTLVTANVINPNVPNPVLSANNPICPGDTLFLQSSGLPPGFVFSWSGPNGFTSNLQNPSIPNFQAINSGAYVFTFNQVGCPPIRDTLFITVGSPTPNLPDSLNLCYGDSVNLPSGLNNIQNPVWTGPNGFNQPGNTLTLNNIDTTFQGKYFFNAMSGNCAVLDSIVIRILNRPFSVIDSISICQGGALNYSPTLPNNTIYNITWNGSNGFSSNQGNLIVNPFNAANSGYYIINMNVGSCNYSDSLYASFVPNPLNLPDTISGCEGDTLLFSQGNINGQNPAWVGPSGFTSSTPGLTIPNFNPTNVGIYTFSIEVNNCNFSDSLFAQLETFNITTPDSIMRCPGDTVDYLLPILINPNYTISWTGPNGFSNNTVQLFIPNIQSIDEGYYYYQISLGACIYNDSIYVGVYNVPSLSFNTSNSGQGSAITTDITYTGPTLGSFNWQFQGNNSQNNPFNFPSFGTGSVNVNFSGVTEDGCLVDTSLNLPLYFEACLQIPNVFTPNSDGINDDFRVKHCGFAEFEMIIFNRWGQQMLVFTDPDIGWDGFFNGQMCPSGVYFYIVKGKFLDFSPFQQHGSVTLLK